MFNTVGKVLITERMLWCCHGYPEKRFPTVRLRRTRRHSGPCKRTERCSPGPSTSQEVGPFKIRHRDVIDGLWRSVTSERLRGDSHIPLDDVAVVIFDVSGQTEVADLCHVMVRQQDVPRCNVSVDALTNDVFQLSSGGTDERSNL